MRVPKHLVTVAIAAAVAGVVSFGAGVAVEASASGSSVTYQACLSSKGALSKVGTATPTCSKTSTAISWNSVGPQGPPGTPATAVNASSSDSGGTQAFPTTICNGCGFTQVAATPPITTSGGRFLITGQFTATIASCISSCQATVAGYLGLNGIVLGGTYTTTLTGDNSSSTISMSQILTYGPGTYPVVMDASYYDPQGGIQVQAVAGSVQVTQLS